MSDAAAFLSALRTIVGPTHVLTGPDADRFRSDWMGDYTSDPVAVVRPATTDEVSAVAKAAYAHGIAMVAVGGNTGLTGATQTTGGLVISLERMNRIRALSPDARTAVVEAGVIISRLHDAAAEHGLYFPLWFGAKGSAMIGGVLSTNAGGANVLRYGSTRAQVLGIEVVLPDGRVLNLMSALHKDNSGYDLKQLFMGAEGTLGIITAAVVKLVPAARAHATAMVAMADLGDALALLNQLQTATGGLVEAFEFMPDTYLNRLSVVRPDLGQPFDTIPPVSLLIELGATAPDLSEAGPDGSVPLVNLLEAALAPMMEQGAITDATLARSEAQRRAMWARREAAAQLTLGVQPAVDTDVSLPLTGVARFLTQAIDRLRALDQGVQTLTVGHLGDGNLHFTVFPGQHGIEDRVMAVVEDVVTELGGSFSAEHGIGLSKLPSMARLKDPVALDVMRAVKSAIDPKGLMNPGKVIPAA